MEAVYVLPMMGVDDRGHKTEEVDYSSTSAN